MNGSSRGIPTNRLSIGLFVLDVVGFVAAFNASYLFAIALWLGVFSLPLAGILLIQLATLYVLNLYSVGGESSRFDVLSRTAFAVILAGLISAGLVYITELRDTQPLFFRGVLPGGFVLFLAWAVVLRYLATIWVERYAQRMRWLVVSDARPDSPQCKDIAAIQDFGEMEVLMDDVDTVKQLPEEIQNHVVGSYAALAELSGRQWSGIVIASEKPLPKELLRRIMEMRLGGIRIYDLTDFYEQFMRKVPVLHLRDNWFALSHGFNLIHHRVELNIKRLLDLGLASTLLLLSLPVMLLIALAIKADWRKRSRGPVLYRQLRTGAHGTEFYIYKFRTMVSDAEADGARWASHNDDRITPVGGFLRSSRLDELPQLYNVLKGDMSFVGPRPERPDFNRKLEQEIPYYDLRHLVEPGITGWAQVMYDYGSSTEDALQKLQYDIYYIKNYSLLLDLFIVLKTLRVILRRRGR